MIGTIAWRELRDLYRRAAAAGLDALRPARDLPEDPAPPHGHRQPLGHRRPGHRPHAGLGGPGAAAPGAAAGHGQPRRRTAQPAHDPAALLPPLRHFAGAGQVAGTAPRLPAGGGAGDGHGRGAGDGEPSRQRAPGGWRARPAAAHRPGQRRHPLVLLPRRTAAGRRGPELGTAVPALVPRRLGQRGAWPVLAQAPPETLLPWHGSQ